MSGHTPSLDDVRTDYAQLTARHRGSFFGNRAEFDRAIAKVRADAKAEALREAADELAPKGILWWGDSGVRVSDGPFGMPQGSLDDWLRNRADNLEGTCQ